MKNTKKESLSQSKENDFDEMKKFSFPKDENQTYNFERKSEKNFTFASGEYNPEKEKIYSMIEEREEAIKKREKDAKERLKEISGRKNRNDFKLEMNFDITKGFENFKIKDKRAEKIKKERDLNGMSEKGVFETVDNFTSEEVSIKTYFSMKFANDKNKISTLNKDYENYVNGETDKIVNSRLKEKNFELAGKGSEENAQKDEHEKIENYSEKKYKEALLEKKFYDTYVPLNEEYKDKKTGVIAWAFGNKKTGKVEIFYGGSNHPSKILSDRITGLDWTNDIRSTIQTPPNYKVALEIAKKINSKTYKIDGKEFSGVEGVNGFSKGGGEVMYVASKMNLKAVVTDPAPVINPGNFINNNKIIAIIPNDGNAMLNRARQIPGSNLFTLEPKTGISEGNGNKKVSMVTAIPVRQKGNAMFNDHFPDVHDVYESIESTKKYIKKIKPEHYAYFGEKKDPYEHLRKKMEIYIPEPKEQSLEKSKISEKKSQNFKKRNL